MDEAGISRQRAWAAAVLCVSALLLSSAAGCRQLNNTVPLGNLHPADAHFTQGGPTGEIYVNDTDHMTFPVPAGFIQLKRDDPKETNTVHMGNAAKVCQYILVRQPSFSDIKTHQEHVGADLNHDGNQVRMVGATQLGSTPATHMHVTYPDRVEEEFYTVQQDESALSIIFIRGPRCTADYGPTIAGFRFK